MNPSMEALTRHPCRVRSRDGERARTYRDGRCAWEEQCWVCLVESRSSGSRSDAHRTTDGFPMSADQLSGAASLPVAGPCGGMDAATEPPGTGSRRVPQAVRAPRPRRCGLAAGPLPAHPRGTRRESIHGGSGAASMPLKVPRRWADKDLSGWSCAQLRAGHGLRCSNHVASGQFPRKPSNRQAFDTKYRNVSSAAASRAKCFR
ncbi:hypothetical protein FHT15_000691 [Xanthomonas campestris]